MKKSITILLSLVLLLSLLSGCGSTAGGNTSAGNGTENAGTSGGGQADDRVTVYLLETKENGSNGAALQSCKYDEAGNLVEENRGGYRYVYVYDQENRNIEWTRYRADDSVHQKNTYQYDEKGNVILKVEESGGYRFEYKGTYNEKGQLVEEVCTRNGEPFDTDTYTYDDQGRVVEYCDGTYSTYHYVYEGNVTRKQVLNKKGDVSEEWVYTYDDNGKLVKEEYWEDGELWTVDEYVRDTSGKAMEHNRYDADDGEKKLETKTVNTYDEKGNLTEKKQYDDENQLVTHYVYKYTELKVSAQRAEELRQQAEKDAQ